MIRGKISLTVCAFVMTVALALLFSGCVEKEFAPMQTPEVEKPSPTKDGGNDAGIVLARFIVKEGSDRTIKVVCPDSGKTLKQNYTNDRIYTCPDSGKGFRFQPSIAIVKNGVTFVPLRGLREDLGLEFAMSEEKVYTPILEPGVIGVLCPDVSTKGGKYPEPPPGYCKLETTTEYYLSKDRDSVTLDPSSSIITVNGERYQMYAPPVSEGSILYVPFDNKSRELLTLDPSSGIIMVNGERYQMAAPPSDAGIVIYVPLKSKNLVSVALNPSSRNITINDEHHQMAAAPFREGETLYVPLKDVVVPFRYKVQREAKSQNIVITR